MSNTRREWIVTGMSMVTEAETEREACERAQDQSGWSWEAVPASSFLAPPTETYNGWTNRETWAVALHINNDRGWQESVLDALRELRGAESTAPTPEPWEAGDVIQETFDNILGDLSNAAWENGTGVTADDLMNTLIDIGSLWRVDWRELGAAFLADMDEETS